MESQTIATVNPQAPMPWIELRVENLPSRGVGYPKGSVIKYRPYTHGEMRQFSIQTASPAQSIEMAVSGLDVQGFDKMKLSILDAFYIGLLRKVSTMSGLQVQVPYVCEGCGKLNEKIFTNADIEFEDLSSEVSSLPLIADLGGQEVHFNLLSVKDFLDLERGRYNKDIPGGKPNALAVEALMVENLSFDKAYNLLYNLTNEEDIEVLEEVDQLLKHDIKPLKARCTQADEDKKVCNHLNLVKLEGREALIRPFRGGDRNTRARIRFGN